MEDEDKRFAKEFANPPSWLLTADNLHKQATAIFARRAYSSIWPELQSFRRTKAPRPAKT